MRRRKLSFHHCPTCRCDIAEEQYLRDEVALLAQLTGVPVIRVVGKSRDARSAYARHTIVAALRAIYPDLTLTLIAYIFDRDHSTIIHSIRTARPEAVAVLIQQYRHAKEQAA